jgi:hypothetical protein
MGIDYLKRFDWALAARIRSLDAAGLAALLERRLAAARTGRAPIVRPCSEALALATSTGRPLAEVVAELLDEGATLDELRNDAIFDLCLQGERVRLGEAASWLDALPGTPGPVSSLDVLPGTDEELFLLLQPTWVDDLLRALQDGAQEPTALPGQPTALPGQLDALARLRDACARKPGQLVAWCFEP